MGSFNFARRRTFAVAALLLVGSTLGKAPSARAEWQPNGNRVSPLPGPRFSSPLTESADGVIVAWIEAPNGYSAADIYATRVTLAGDIDPKWPPGGVPVCAAPGTQTTPNLVSDGSGGAFIVWLDSRDGLYGVFAQRVTSAGAIAPGWQADGMRLCTGVGGSPFGVSDGTGGMLIAWRDDQSGANDLRMTRVTSAGTIKAGWPLDGLVVVPGTPEPNGIVDLVTDEQEGAILVWNTFINSDVYALRVTGNGVVAPDWPSSGFIVSGAPGNQTDPRAAPDGAGGALITWYDARSDNGDIYATHLLADATLATGWSTDGNPVCTAPADQRNPSIAADGVGGCLVVWEDFRDGTSYDIYGQRLTGGGSLVSGWTQDGVPLSLAAGHQTLPQALHDGSGGVISVWQDGRVDIGDIYAQRILPTGSTASGWTFDGIPLVVLPRSQDGPSLASDGFGGAIISWTDCRTDTCDVYVQRVTAEGEVGPDIPPPPPIITDLSLSPPWPNPSQTSLSITIQLPYPSALILEILDTAGRVVTEVTRRRATPAGEHVFRWDGRNRQGKLVSPGIYYLRARTESESASHRIVRL